MKSEKEGGERWKVKNKSEKGGGSGERGEGGGGGGERNPRNPVRSKI